MNRLTVKTETGACSKLECHQNGYEAKQQPMERFKIACNKLADYEDEAERREKGVMIAQKKNIHIQKTNQRQTFKDG